MPIRTLSTRTVICIVAGLSLALTGCRAVPDRGPESRPVFYPLPPSPPRVQLLTVINTFEDVTAERTGLQRLLLGARDDVTLGGVLRQPYGIAVWKGKIYVCDHRGGAAAVKVFDVLNQKAYVLGRGIVGSPTNIHIDSAGNKFVVESMKQAIYVFGPDDEYITAFAVKDGRPGDLVAIGSELFVSDVTGNRILVLDRATGKLLRTFGSPGLKPGQFAAPSAMDCDKEGNLYVCDQMNFRWQKLDTTGKPLLTAGGAGDSYGHFQRPRGISVGPDGIVYVVESIYEVVQMFNAEGRVLMAFGNFRAAPGAVQLPAGVAVDTSCLPYFSRFVDPRFEAKYLIFVVSQLGAARIGVYAFGQLKEGAEMPKPAALQKPVEPKEHVPLSAKPLPEGPAPLPPDAMKREAEKVK